ncbi:DUF2147 domain-containing protein [Echinicola sp. CAU 1574]|uniref:DUF2147 domain-containing protein n=1 Tax=Echinicola arenosa TaxID=2774144 RepID=A0ABR9APG0_9BACT|nr:DUF2147 domain-containing protein [Echinicola arenosa]MBD8490677.1 DUF2147 domain-containing protein [Echinicola arenosa]
MFFIWPMMAQDGEEILGEWVTSDGSAKLEIEKEEDGFFARVVWLANPNENGAPKLDHQNADRSLRRRPILGLKIIEDLHYKDGKWVNGELYDPESGETYSCQLKLDDKGVLEVRGYLGMPVFGRSVFWKRVN